MSSRNQSKIYTGFVSNATAWMNIQFQLVPRRFIMVTTIICGIKFLHRSNFTVLHRYKFSLIKNEFKNSIILHLITFLNVTSRPFEQHKYMAQFEHVSALTGVAVQDMSLEPALLVGNLNSPKSFKHEWDRTEMLCFVKPVKAHLAHELYSCHMQFCVLGATESQASEGDWV